VPRKPKYRTPIQADAIGKRLRQIRTQAAMTQAELADKVGMPQALVSDYELGKLRLHGGLIVAFAKALNVTADEILGLKEPKPSVGVSDRRLIKRLALIDTLPKRKRQALLTTLDEFLKGAGAIG
jgi:transcriptional regulator with XRE-family HTH domain